MHKKSIVLALIGHILERYDMALYGYFSTLLAPIFFPHFNNGNISIMASFGAFAAGYIMRPFGGIIFGHIGDRYGRKKAFTLSMCFVVVPTFIIGVLPSYQYIGILAPIILILCRLLQGLCNGGEFSGAGIFIGEHLPKKNSGFGGSLVCAGGLLGAALGTIFGTIVNISGTPDWSWRLPFIVGSIMTFIAWRMREGMFDPHIFQKILAKNSVRRYPLLTVFGKHKTNILCALIIGGFGHVILYTITIYMSSIYITNFKTTPFMLMLINSIVLIWWIILSPLAGLLADKCGALKVMSFATIAIATFSFPVFFYLYQDISIYHVFIAQIILSTIGVVFVAPISSLFTVFFPIRERYSGVAFSITLGQALLGGPTPLIVTFLSEILATPIAPAYFIIFWASFAIIALMKTKNFTY